jgi:hypothetical protein
MDLPIDTKHELVMSAAGFDGHAITTHRFRSVRPPEQLADSLRERWQSEGVRFIETTRGEWMMLSSRREAAIETLQLRRTPAGTEGLHSLWRRDPDAQGGASSPTSVIGATVRMRGWLPEGARPIREIVHRDGPRQAATVVATAADTPRALSDQLKRRMAVEGFLHDPSLDSGRAGAAAGVGLSAAVAGQALAFRRGGEEVVVTVAAHRGESAIVMHWSRQQ